MIVEWRDDELIKATRNAMHEATKSGADHVARLARLLVKKRTATLAGQIDVEVSEYEDGGHLVWAQGKGRYGKYYASFVELGTYKDPKQPFMRPALKRSRNRIKRGFEDKIR
jgi:HK97 gp10 family phage protein